MARTHKTLESAAKKLGGLNGYKGGAGAWIYKNRKCVYVQGWWSMGQIFLRRGYITGNDRDGYTLVITDLTGRE